MGPWLATALVVGNLIGSGVFLLPAALAEYVGISIIGWLFTGVGAVLLALAFARLLPAGIGIPGSPAVLIDGPWRKEKP